MDFTNHRAVYPSSVGRHWLSQMNSNKVIDLAYDTMCVFHEYDLDTKRGQELAESEWDACGDRWLEVVMFLREDVVTEPPKPFIISDEGIAVVGNVRIL